MKNFNVRNISEYQPHFLKHDTILNEIAEKSHYEKLYALELEMKLIEEKMGERDDSVISIYENLSQHISNKFESIDMLFTKLDYVDTKESHDVLEDIDERLAQLEDKILTLKGFFREQ